jgi:hypothetical protein
MSANPKDAFKIHEPKRAFPALLVLEMMILTVLLVLLTTILIVGVRYEHARIFTNVSIIMVFGALLAETIRRARHLKDGR